MKKLLILIILFCSSTVFAQDSLQYFNMHRNQIKTTGMTVLGSWGLANLAVGAVGYNNSDGSTKYFHQMNSIWGIINFAIAVPGYISGQKDKHKTLSATASLNDQKKIETIFLINGGLDVVYITSGIILKDRGDTNNSDRLRGYGSSIIMQGAFLLLFDATMYTSEKSNGNKLRAFLQKHPVTFDGQKVGMVWNL